MNASIDLKKPDRRYLSKAKKVVQYLEKYLPANYIHFTQSAKDSHLMAAYETLQKEIDSKANNVKRNYLTMDYGTLYEALVTYVIPTTRKPKRNQSFQNDDDSNID